MSDLDKLLTILEAAERCNASPSWIRKAIHLGLLPFTDLALGPSPKRREPRIKLSDLEAFLRSRERAAQPAPAALVRMGAPGEVRRRVPRRRAALG